MLSQARCLMTSIEMAVPYSMSLGDIIDNNPMLES